MSSFSVPAQWSERRLYFELDVVSDELNEHAAVQCDRSSYPERRLLGTRLAELRMKRLAIEERLCALAVPHAA